MRRLLRASPRTPAAKMKISTTSCPEWLLILSGSELRRSSNWKELRRQALHNHDQAGWQKLSLIIAGHNSGVLLSYLRQCNSDNIGMRKHLH